MVDNLSCLIESSEEKVGVAYLYADYQDQEAQTLAHILGSLLKQFLFGLSIKGIQWPEKVRNSLERIRTNGKAPSKDNLLKLLGFTLEQLDRAFLCIDALDQFEANTRGELLREISNLLKSSTCGSLRVFLTGRKHIKVEVEFREVSGSSVEIYAHDEDIRLYLGKKIADDANPESMDEALQKQIEDSLVEQSKRMWVKTSGFHGISKLTPYL